MDAGVQLGAPLPHPRRKPGKVWKLNKGMEQCDMRREKDLPANLLEQQTASISSLDALHQALQRKDFRGLVEMLLPGAEHYFRYGLEEERLSSTAEKKRRGFIDRLNVLSSAGGLITSGGEVSFCPRTPDSEDDCEVPTTVSNLMRESSDSADIEPKDVEDEGMEFEEDAWHKEYDEMGVSYTSHNTEDELDTDSSSETCPTDPEFIPATVALAAGPPPNWVQGNILGHGAYGEVYECLNKRTGRDLGIVVKNILLHRPEMEKEVKKEISVMERISHERIVQYHGHDVVETGGVKTYRIFMECMTGGSLKQYLQEHALPHGRISEIEASRYTRQILEGLMYLHSKGIIHRDIKSANILMGKNNVKLGDLGAAKFMDDLGESGKVVTFCGTNHWLSPELIRGRGYGRKTDIWSLGCTIVEMLTGESPWSELGPYAVIYAIGKLYDDDEPSPTFKLNLPDNTSEEAKSIINLCFQEKDNRPSAQELLQHPFCQLAQRNQIDTITNKMVCSTLESPKVQDIDSYW